MIWLPDTMGCILTSVGLGNWLDIVVYVRVQVYIPFTRHLLYTCL